jgi:hypothetical protein
LGKNKDEKSTGIIFYIASEMAIDIFETTPMTIRIMMMTSKIPVRR